MNVISDQTARDAIVGDLDRTLFVEAGAGSGKTTSLVGRFVALVLAGADVTQIAAITFTEAAASELRARVREALEDVAAGSPRRGVAPTADHVDRARVALDDLDRATVSTLHSFAQRLLAAAPIEAALPPRIEVHDEISTALRTTTRWARFVNELLDVEALRPTLRAALALGISVAQLEAVAATLNQNWDLLVDLDLDGERTPLTADDLRLPIDGLVAAAGEVLAMADACPDPDDKLCIQIRERVPTAVRLVQDAAALDPFVLLEMCGSITTIPKNVGGKDNWPDGGKDAVQAIWSGATEAIAGARDAITDRVLRRLGVELAAYTLREADARRAEGRLEFHDLLVLARAVLRTDEGVRRRMHDRYRHLLLDEFQDTDPIQVELAVRIAADPSHDPTTPWDEVDVAPGRLFFVGDPKQSIYRFRRADIDLFARTGDRHRDGALRLDTNFRTVAPILERCNDLFGVLINEEVVGDDIGGRGEMAQPAYAPLVPARPAIAGDPGPAMTFLGGPEPDGSADSLRRAEAIDMVATLERARRDGWLVHPAGDPAPRPCRWSDMAVLVPSRTSLPHLRRALDAADVPYRLETGSLVYATTEIRDVLSALRAIDDPGDAVSVVGALRSPAYGCGDDDLASWHRAIGSWSYLGVDERIAATDRGTDGPASVPPMVVADAMRDLERWHRRRTFDPVPTLVGAFIRHRGLMASSLAGGRHRDAWRLYRVLVEHARLFAETEAGGLAAFLTWSALQSDDKLRITAPVLPEADVDAVRIMTIHGAKGLEFPITAVSGLSGLFADARRGPQVRFRPEGGFDVRLGKGLETGQFDSRRTVEDVMGEQEGIRLLYVALTRARDHLVVSLHHKPADRVKCHAQRLASAIAALGWSTEAPPQGVALDPGSSAHKADHLGDDERAMVDVAPVGSHVTVEDRQAWRVALEDWEQARLALLTRSRRAGVVSATTLRRSGATPVDAFPDDASDRFVGDPWRRGRLGTSVGSAVHAVLQHADLTDAAGTDVEALARWQADSHGVPDAVGEIAAKARAGLASGLVRQAVASGRWWRELHVGLPLAAVVGPQPGSAGADLFEGFIDLAFQTEDGLVIVDYKTDAVTSQATADRAADGYAIQGAAYAEALEAATGIPVAEVHFLFLGARGSVTATVADLDHQRAEVRALLAAPRPGEATGSLTPAVATNGDGHG